MNSKIIIVTTLVLLLVSFSVLFVIEKNAESLDAGKNWTVAYFENPDNESLNFFIENHQGISEKYTYEIFVADQSVAKNDVEIAAGAKQEISPILESEKIVGNRVTAEISLGDVKYKIYKDIR